MTSVFVVVVVELIVFVVVEVVKTFDLLLAFLFLFFDRQFRRKSVALFRHQFFSFDVYELENKKKFSYFEREAEKPKN